MARKEPSLSSTSATAQSLRPSRSGPASPSGSGTRPPTMAVASRPAARSRWPVIAVVVVLPWDPAIATTCCSSRHSASSAPRPTISTPRARAATSSGLSCAIADERTTTSAVPMRSAPCPTATGIPSRRRRSTFAPATTSVPVTTAPCACSSSARAAMPIPPTPTKWKRSKRRFMTAFAARSRRLRSLHRRRRAVRGSAR